MYPVPSKNENFPQQNKNRAALRALLALGYPLDRIRSALLALNGLRVHQLDASDVSKTVVYAAVKGKTQHYKAMRVIAQALGLHVEELFDEDPGTLPDSPHRQAGLPDGQAGAQAATMGEA